MSQIIPKNFFKRFFHEFFRYLYVSDGRWKINTSSESVLGTTSWSESSSGKKDPSFSTPQKITSLFYWTFEFHSMFWLLVNRCWPKFLCDKKAPIVPYTTLTSEFSYLTWFLRYLHFHVRIRLDRILK